ncbi:MAG TPA: DNA repair protein RecO [Acidobacteriota bacterium]|nr:DNA repair protein RecO [Acidobacteriota bacterium]
MPLEKSEAVILRMFNWSESSRTVVFFTRDFGKLRLQDKGGRRLTTKRGRLLPFTRTEVTFYRSERSGSGYISDSEVLEAFSLEGQGELGRLAYASAACELLYLLLPEQETQPELYEYSIAYLRQVAAADRRALPPVFISFFLRLMSQLGYRPSLAYCAGCSTALDRIIAAGQGLVFAPERGGVLCRACQKAGERYIPVSAGGARLLAALQRASLAEAASLPIGYEDACRLIEALTKFLKYHSGLVSDLKSLAFLEKLKNKRLNG